MVEEVVAALLAPPVPEEADEVAPPLPALVAVAALPVVLAPVLPPVDMREPQAATRRRSAEEAGGRRMRSGSLTHRPVR